MKSARNPYVLNEDQKMFATATWEIKMQNVLPYKKILKHSAFYNSLIW